MFEPSNLSKKSSTPLAAEDYNSVINAQDVKNIKADALNKAAKKIAADSDIENELVSLQETESESEITKTVAVPRSAVSPWDAFWSHLIPDDDSKDGKIGYTKQHKTGDCWLLSTINSLSYTEEGRNLIKNSLKYHDKYTVVNLNGFGEVIVTNKEVAETKFSKQYASGDDDMIIYELAVEKILDSIASADIKIDKPLSAPINDRTATTVGKSSVVSGNMNDAYYLVTGIFGTSTKDSNTQLELLQEFKENGGENIAMGFDTPEGNIKVKDVNGKNITLCGRHSYAIKEVTSDNNVVIVNPWDSSKGIVISAEELVKIGGIMHKCDLSGDKTNAILTPTVNDEGFKSYERKCDKKEASDCLLDNNAIVKEYTRYSPDGVLCRAKYYDKDGHIILEREYDDKGKIKNSWSFSPDGLSIICARYDESGNLCKTKYYTREDTSVKSADWTLVHSYDNADCAKEIIGRNLLFYPQFSDDEVMELAKLPNDEWQIVQEELELNPDASYSYLMKLLS